MGFPGSGLPIYARVWYAMVLCFSELNMVSEILPFYLIHSWVSVRAGKLGWILMCSKLVITK